MKKYFIPHKHGISWSEYFREDAERQGWKMEIVGYYKTNTNAIDIYRTDESRMKGGSSNHWYVMKTWGKVVEEEEPLEIKLDDKLFEI